MKRLVLMLLLFTLAAIAPVAAQTQTVVPEAAKVDTGDTAWMLISTALVMLMTPGLALFYGGMVRRKNVLGTIMQSFIALAVITVVWVLWGYSLAFGPSFHGVIGTLEWAGLAHVGIDPNAGYAPTVPHQSFMIFQMMFAIITPALITGAVAERIKFSTYLVFIVLWSTLVYAPVAHWVWNIGGWMRSLGALDFAGGLVVHITSGVTALAAVFVVGKRRGHTGELTPPHNLTMTLMGASLLWFGWFGFNAGSAIASGALATSAFVATHIAAASATLSWLFIEWKHRGQPTVLGAASGAVAGLVAITPASGYVGPIAAIIIGTLAGGVCYYAISLKAKFNYDDSLDAVGVHGVGGTLGALLTGLFASKLINSAGSDGLFYGNMSLFLAQAESVAIVIIYTFAVSWVLLKLLDAVLGLRVTDEHELIGLDLSQHGESGYSF
ncbi:MAG TPA: ammonium transporter [Bacteroidota bacterium]|nr:ammonium transporter [Bacteroidota bacterium]